MANIISYDLNDNKIYVFFWIDIYTSKDVILLFKIETISTSNITKALNRVIEKKLIIKLERKLIICTNQANQFVKEYKEFIRSSMPKTIKW